MIRGRATAVQKRPGMRKATALLAILTSLTIIFANVKNIVRQAKLLTSGEAKA